MIRGGAAAETAGFFCFGFFFSGRRASLFPMPTRCHRSPNLASASFADRTFAVAGRRRESASNWLPPEGT